MDFVNFLREMLGITEDFAITSIEKDETDKVIKIHLKYLFNRFNKGGKSFKIYDYAPVREWQHLSWFEYRCYLVCSLPRYLSEDGKPKVIDIHFAPKSKGYTYLFAEKIIEALTEIKVQRSVAKLFRTTPYIVRSIMESVVESALLQRGEVSDLEYISLDEKAYTQGHKYASILIDSSKNYVVEMIEGRKEKNVKALFFSLNSQERQPKLKRVSIDMWKPYINAITDIAPQAQIVHDKFHLFKKLSDAINQTRKWEVKHNDQLKKHKYTVLKNKENRTEHQETAFLKMMEDNLKTAQAWLIRENFKTLFQENTNVKKKYKLWKKDALSYSINAVNNVIETFDRHLQGIINAIITKTSSAMHENINGKIQSIIAKARGFLNFDRFRINVLFYLGNLNLKPLKFY
jgi:transposase